MSRTTIMMISCPVEDSSDGLDAVSVRMIESGFGFRICMKEKAKEFT